MLKATSPKVLVDASMDKTWGTGIQLCDPSTLDMEKWHNTGWMSSMLATIWEIELN